MKAIILCAGYGTRMEPYTHNYQKVMIPIFGKPILEYLILAIKKAGIKDFILVVGYRKEQIINYFEYGKSQGINIEYIHQENLNGTGGALLLCESFINETNFFLTWGDTLVAPETYEKVIKIHRDEKEPFILVANVVNDPYRGAAIYLNGDYCKDIIEKPPKGVSKTNLNNAGIFILKKDIFEVLRTQEPSKRGEIEVPEAFRYGMRNLDWKFRVVEMNSKDFYADFGNKNQFEILKNDSKWLKLFN